MNKDIIDNLYQHLNKSVLEKDTFRINAYRKAISQIKDLNFKITHISQLDGMSGIGKGIGEKIKDVLMSTPQVANIPAVYEELMRIPGVGPVKARELVNVHHIKSINELRKKTYLLEPKQNIGLKYYDYTLLQIPNTEIDKHFDYLMYITNIFVNTSKDINNKDIKMGMEGLKIDIAGSYRRGAKISSNIDIILTSNHNKVFHCYIQILRENGYIVDTLSEGDTIFTGFAKFQDYPPRRINIIYTNTEEYPYTLLYFTGPTYYNDMLRITALNAGLILNRYGLFKGDKLIKLETEEDIIRYLGLKYIKPINR